ncbi:carbohydrate ABC transporter permease [Cohnella fermenti]|uniref:Carbohydrate ABC transporter permease n=1 Tax=Cohnella fermenti TaxID=2565925 RepID=A0A4S4CDP5_9BACL|nr:carbohydrate ABC transporter permease [Cohnella fermenti]THF84098.1 carbohydrate ABC transporter permease [Cohnella fermenti]
MNTARRIVVRQSLMHLLMIVLVILLLYPLFIALWISVKDVTAFKQQPWLPTLPMWLGNYSYAWKAVDRYMFNTVFVGAVSTAGLLFLSSLSAYVFARMRFPGREGLYMAVIALMMVPGVLTFVPTYMVYNSLGMLDTYLVLIIPTIIGGSVGGIFLLRAFFNGLPEAIFEAARLDGCSEFNAYWRVCMPLSLPILGTLAVMTIIGIWNDVIWPMTTISDERLFTISAGLFMKFNNDYSTNVPVLFAGYTVASLPLIFLFLFANRFYIEGLTSAGLKL